MFTNFIKNELTNTIQRVNRNNDLQIRSKLFLSNNMKQCNVDRFSEVTVTLYSWNGN